MTSSLPAPTPLTPDAPARCPCGHDIGDEYLCIEGRIYGPCGHEDCGGVCEYYGECNGDGCACEEDE